MDEDWFDDSGETLDEVQAAFLAVLRRRAADWPGHPADTILYIGADAYSGRPPPGTDGRGRLQVVVDICAEDDNVVLLTIGAFFHNDRVIGDEVHNQLFHLPDKPTPLRFEAAGSPEECAELTADWVQEVMGRPVWREEWFNDTEVYAHRWVMDRFGSLADGHVRTRDLPPPLRRVQVRGQRT